MLVTVAVPGAPARAMGWRVQEGPSVALPDAGQALDWALDGYGEARVPLTLAREALDAGRLEERGPRTPIDEAYWLCAPAPQWKSPKVRDLVGALTTGAATGGAA
jgi:LysR family glycine cleavage system transcriptional activator